MAGESRTDSEPYKMQARARISGLWLLSVLLCLAIPQMTRAERTNVPPQTCKVKHRDLAAAVEKFRNGDWLDGEYKAVFMYCREARPLLKKYALDADRNIRDAMTGFLGFMQSRFNLEVLIMQVEAYPLVSHQALYKISTYHCEDLNRIKTERLIALRNALFRRAREAGEWFYGPEVRALGCLARNDQPSREFLEQMLTSASKTQISEQDRESLKPLIIYAFAGLARSEAVNYVLAEIEKAEKQGDPRDMWAVLEGSLRFLNPIILERLSRLILDKREGLSQEVKGSRQKLRIGDLAVSAFTVRLGRKATGENDPQWRPHTDQELEKIYSRVRKYLSRKKGDY